MRPGVAYTVLRCTANKYSRCKTVGDRPLPEQIQETR